MKLAEQIDLSANARQVLESRYLLTRDGARETPGELFHRVAKEVSSVEIKWGSHGDMAKWESRFYLLMTELLFLPNSPTLMNAGTPLNQLSACFVLPVEDSLADIFTSLKNAALIQQSGGGTGFNFSHLRPKNDPLTIVGGTSSGPVSFMKIFNASTEYVKYGGKRRGANMGILNVNHPDIEEFISSKKDETELNNFNISVGITDDFMHAVTASAEWPLIHPNTNKVIKTVNAREIWNTIVENAWSTGDPGLIFLDTINMDNPLKLLGRIESTNPCGEVPLFPYEACNLGSINLVKMLKMDNSIDWEKLSDTTTTAVRFLDNIIEVNNYVIPETSVIAHANRKIGLGIMGWADLLVLKQIPYDSEEAVALAKKIMYFIDHKAKKASESLARERGCFPNWEKSTFYPDYPRRNATILSIAPTGTISIVADVSSSIEPLFALSYERKNVLDGKSLFEINKYFLDYVNKNENYPTGVVNKVRATGNLAGLDSLPNELKQIFKTAHEISPEWHLRHQVTFQQYVDNAVSKTINLPESSTVRDVASIYEMAWREKAKGITIFRDRSKSKQVLSSGISGQAQACGICSC